MKSTGAWASLALLVLLVASSEAHCTSCGSEPPCGCDSRPNVPSQAKIVTYGEPCFCKESFPYSIQVPQSPVPSTPEETRRSYGYSVVTPPTQNCRSLQLPVKVQTPIIRESSRDTLSGRSYGVAVQHQAQCDFPRSYNFDFAVQRPVEKKVDKPVFRPSSLGIAIQHAEERVCNPRFAPLPIAIQTPVVHNKLPERFRLTDLSATVDRVLVPACEVNGCPDCNDILPKKYYQKPSYLPCA